MVEFALSNNNNNNEWLWLFIDTARLGLKSPITYTSSWVSSIIMWSDLKLMRIQFYPARELNLEYRLYDRPIGTLTTNSLRQINYLACRLTSHKEYYYNPTQDEFPQGRKNSSPKWLAIIFSILMYLHTWCPIQAGCSWLICQSPSTQVNKNPNLQNSKLKL